MISSQQIDGTCYRMIIWYEKEPDEHSEDHVSVMYGEDISELFRYFEEVKHLFPYIRKIGVLDYSQ